VHLSDRQIFLTCVILSISGTLVHIPTQMVVIASQSAWMAVVSSSIITLLIIWMVALLSKRFPRQDLIQVVVRRSPFVGRGIVLGYLVFALMILARDLRAFAGFVEVVLLPTTPIYVTVALAGLTAILCARSGLVTLGRMAELVMPPFIVAIALMPILTASELRPKFAYPLFNGPLLALAEATWITSPQLVEAILLVLILTQRTGMVKPTMYGVLTGHLMLLLVIILNLLVLGPNMNERLIYAGYETVRSIRLTDFLDRFDLIIVGLWIPTLLVKAGIILHFICNGLFRLAPDLSEREMATPFGILGVALSLWFFANAMEVAALNSVWPPFAIVFWVIIPVLLFLFLRHEPLKVKAPTKV